MKHYFIYNPAAGNGDKGKDFLNNFEKLKHIYGDNVNLVITSRCGEATELAYNIAHENANEEIAIYACGGDGTMNEVVNGLVGSDNVIFGIVPTGSCNDFLKCNDFVGRDFLDLEKQVNGNVSLLDVIKAGNTYCLNVANIGFDAKVNYDQIRYRKKFKTIKGAYNYAILVNALKKKGDNVKVTIDGKVFYEGKTLLMAFANGSYYGGGYNCGPKASLNDGLVDCTFIKNVSIFRFVSLVAKYKKGLLYDNEEYKKIIKCTRGKKIEISSDNYLTICLDGETIHKKEETIEVLNQKLKFMVPSL